MIKNIDRRNFLRGSGACLALPSLTSVANASAISNSRADDNPRRMVCIGSHLGFWPGGFFPTDSGTDYETSLTLGPIDTHREDFTVFSNLDHATGGGHSGVHAFLSGVRKEEAGGFPEKNRSLDQAAAEFSGSATRFPSLTTGIGDGTAMCWNRSGVNIPPISEPAKLFQALFVQSDAATQATKRKRLGHRASILDALRESAQQLNRKLNVEDRNKLDQYFTSVRSVEKRLQMSQQWLDRPKPKSPIEAVENEERMHIEEMPLFYDLLTLALQTDSTRVATFEIPMGFRTPELGVGSYHGLSHHGKAADRLEQLQKVEAYFMKQFGRFLSQLKEAELLERTLVVLGSGMGNAHKHSNRDLPVLLAGGSLQHQGHLVCPEQEGKRIPLCNLWLSCLHWFGMREERFNKSTGTFSAMEIS